MDGSAGDPKPGYLIQEPNGTRRLVSCVDMVHPAQVAWERPTLSGTRKTQWVSLSRWRESAEKFGWVLLMENADTVRHCPKSENGDHQVGEGQSYCSLCDWTSPKPRTGSLETRWSFRKR